MAKRMFSDEITLSDAFLDMPTESQLAYFHLGMHADDDGFISSIKMIQRIIGASDDSIKILFAKKFLINFDSGVCVIKHWRINNYIRKDIYRETKYLVEKKSLFIRENGSYTLNPDQALPVPTGHFIIKDEYKNNYVDVTSTSRALSIGKVRIGKGRIEESIPSPTPPKKKAKKTADGVTSTWEEFWELYPRKVGKEFAKTSFFKIEANLYPTLIEAIKIQKEGPDWKETQFIPHASTWLNQKRWEDEITMGSSNPMEEYAKECARKWPDNPEEAMFEFKKRYTNNDVLKMKHIIRI